MGELVSQLKRMCSYTSKCPLMGAVVQPNPYHPFHPYNSYPYRVVYCQTADFKVV